jgi:FixJ family two-component response regulator
MPVPWAHHPAKQLPAKQLPAKQLRERICIVDDDDGVADSLKLLLETFGYDAQSYNLAGDFLADDRQGAASCLIIDQHMPDVDGLDVIDHLQKQGSQVPTILISGRLDTHIKERAASLGITSVLEKPFAGDRLIALIRTALLERNSCSP